MLPKADMGPKQSGFNQSETACGLCAGYRDVLANVYVNTPHLLPSWSHNLQSKLKLYVTAKLYAFTVSLRFQVGGSRHYRDRLHGIGEDSSLRSSPHHVLYGTREAAPVHP